MDVDSESWGQIGVVESHNIGGAYPWRTYLLGACMEVVSCLCQQTGYEAWGSEADIMVVADFAALKEGQDLQRPSGCSARPHPLQAFYSTETNACIFLPQDCLYLLTALTDSLGVVPRATTLTASPDIGLGVGTSAPGRDCSSFLAASDRC